nr:hypothetical protein [Edaphobacter acidisoli]
MNLSGEFGLKEPTNFALRQTLFFQCVNELVDQFLRATYLFCPGQASPAGSYECSESMEYFQHAFLFQLAIDLDDGIGIDDERFRKTPNAWQLVSGRDCAGFDCMANLFLDLNVDGDAG